MSKCVNLISLREWCSLTERKADVMSSGKSEHVKSDESSDMRHVQKV